LLICHDFFDKSRVKQHDEGIGKMDNLNS
jgi:hypothetical protein